MVCFKEADYECARCVFCHTGYELSVVGQIERSGAARAIFPMKVKRVRRRGGWQEQQVPLMASYVFVYSDASFQCGTIERMQHVASVLRYGDNRDGILRGKDRAFADMIWEREGKVGVLRAVRVGDRVEIVDGFFKALGGRVVAMDKRKQVAQIEMDVVGDIKAIWLSFDYIKESTQAGAACCDLKETP